MESLVVSAIQAATAVKTALDEAKKNKESCRILANRWSRMRESLQKQQGRLAGESHRPALRATVVLAEETIQFIAKFSGQSSFKSAVLQLGGFSDDKSTILDLGNRLDELIQEMQLGIAVDTSVFLADLENRLDGAAAAGAAAAAELVLGGAGAEKNYSMVDRQGKASQPSDAYLGEGTFAKTYCMRHADDQMLYAVKIVDTERAKALGNISREEVKTEARMLGRVNHHNVVRYYGCHFVENDFWLVMELVQGDTLHSYISQSPTIGEILSWARQIASGLKHLHLDLRMLHRDIMSRNIMVSRDRKLIKIIDMGFAKVLHSSGTISQVGAAYYASKEKGLGLRYGPSDDLWGLGCVLVELVMRQPLNSALWYSELSETRKNIILTSRALSEDVGVVVAGLLEMSPASRMTAHQLLTFLQVC